MDHRPECKCVVCARPAQGRKHTKVCISIPQELWATFGDECLLAGVEKSPTVAKLVALWLRHRKKEAKE